MTSGTTHSPRESRWIPWAFVGLFAAFLAADGALIYFAFGTWTGIETEGAYEKGLDYNRTLAAAGSQDALGWQVEMDIRPVGDGQARVEVALRDGDGQAVKARLVRARLIRPTHAGFDTEAVLTDLGGGHYGGRIELKLPGQWELRVLADHSGGTYQATRRVVLKPDG
jgi:nitrogen fixation protein FixH